LPVGTGTLWTNLYASLRAGALSAHRNFTTKQLPGRAINRAGGSVPAVRSIPADLRRYREHAGRHTDPQVTTGCSARAMHDRVLDLSGHGYTYGTRHWYGPVRLAVGDHANRHVNVFRMNPLSR